MKRKLLAIIVLIVLACLAFAGCDGKKNEEPESNVLIVTTPRGGPIRAPLEIAVEMNKQFSVDEPYKYNIKFGHVHHYDVFYPWLFTGKLSIYNGEDMVNAKTPEEKAQVKRTVLYETDDFYAYENYIKHNYDEDGYLCDMEYPLSLDLEIPKEYIKGEEGRICFVLATVRIEKRQDGTDYTLGVGVEIKYEIKDGMIYFSKWTY